MAAYDYRCRVCDSAFEVRRGVTEEPGEVRCPSGHGDVARVWSATAVVGAASAAPVRASAPSGGCCGGGCCG